MNNMIYAYQLLILDYGGVYSFKYNPTAQDTIMQKSFGKIPTTEQYAAIHPFSSQLAANQIISSQYVKYVAEILNTPPPNYAIFEEATISVTYDPSPAMVDFVNYARSSGLSVSLLSDMFLFEVTKTKPWGRFDGFDYVSLSAEIGASKDTPEAFMHTLKHFNVPAESVLFVDDKMSNIITAQSVGLHCLWADKHKYVSVESLVEDIMHYLKTKI
jgi:HAD superfamily hydrolase (TIGR01509 family)